MVYKIQEVRMPLGYDYAELKVAVSKLLGTSSDNISEVRLLKKSLDARRKGNICLLLTVACETVCELKSQPFGVTQYEFEPNRITELKMKHKKPEETVYIIGSGPSGLFAALTLATFGIKVVVIERGQSVSEREKIILNHKLTGVFDVNTNVQFGEGGAGTFSDGKLTTGTRSGFNSIILGEFAAHGAPEEILYSARPHIGTDYLKKVVCEMRKTIISLGGEFCFGSKLTDIGVKDGHICSITVNKEVIPATKVIFAIGHSARDTYKLLHLRGAVIVPKPFSIGVRIEHLQSEINKIQYGTSYSDMLPPAEYKLSAHLPNGRGVYTFCMCPGGEVVSAASEEGGIVTNGMSCFKRDGVNSNAALLVSVSPSDFGSGSPLSGIDFQRKYESAAYKISGSFAAPVQRVEDFLLGKVSSSFGDVLPTYKPSTVFADLGKCLPSFATEGIRAGLRHFDAKMRGFACGDALLTGVETRSSAPVRIVRDDNAESNIRGLFPIGEGAGYAGGIMSSAADGISAAIKIHSLL